MSEKKVSLGTVICLIIIFILIMCLAGMWYYYNHINVRNSEIELNNNENIIQNDQENKNDDKEELELIEKISCFPQEIEDAALSFDPSKITKYVVGVASLFHTFYNAKRVKVEDENLMKARIMLIKAVKVTIKNALDVLGISAPERM